MSDLVVRAEARDYMAVLTTDEMLYQREQIRQYVSSCLVESKPGQVDGDYGTIPGAGTRKVLLLPGAQKLCRMRGLSPDYEVMSEDEDWTGERHGGEPFFNYKIKCILFREDRRMGSGVGACNSFEKKYRYVKQERTCPTCGSAAIGKSKEEWGGGWYCNKNRGGGCGAKFQKGDARIEGQAQGQVANPDVADLQNTILKMAKKRAYIDATLSVVGASEFFTQDIETEQERHAPQQEQARPAPQRPVQQAKPEEAPIEAVYVPTRQEKAEEEALAAAKVRFRDTIAKFHVPYADPKVIDEAGMQYWVESLLEHAEGETATLPDWIMAQAILADFQHRHGAAKRNVILAACEVQLGTINLDLYDLTQAQWDALFPEA
jgi:hypothetical protein